MHQNRTKYPQKKVQMYQQLQELPKKYKVIALVRMEKVRSSQLLPLRKKFKGEVEIISIKDKVAQKALASLKIPPVEKLADKLVGQCILLFTNMSPFKLNILLSKNKIMLPARGGDKASIEVVIKAGNTGITPGPILTDFKEAGVATKIDQGTIWITKDSTAAKKGDVISVKLATLLSKLDVKPVEAGIVLNSALEENIVYNQEEIVIDVEKYRDAFARAHQEALALSIEIGYVNKENANIILAKAAQHARSLATESGFLTDETKKVTIQKANARARALAGKLKNYTPQ
ncbi:MAG: 50S ribosomal protein L10 [Thaumarchaeota archaeon 13_1_40CM_4_38_7]|nr:MAG: 50S ribosomal protein L10 [Thaumarchaeota archaeon 13_1_40CM_4_38_7]OLC94346.1 MAG: 50S ribosomal protein L10 [Thaumarchaeota archaeon 13_1_40CM_3_38_6]OLD28673.1 MAG: 50S ribosomal protein L10 [Thaumarchaeota archaeon 13_1_40CM_2_39_7]